MSKSGDNVRLPAYLSLSLAGVTFERMVLKAAQSTVRSLDRSDAEIALVKIWLFVELGIQ